MTRALLRLALLTITAAAAIFAQSAGNTLTNFKVYSGTIDYAAGGVGLSGKADAAGLAQGSIDVTVPPNAEILAAFLYWMTVEKTDKPSSFQGYVNYPRGSASYLPMSAVQTQKGIGLLGKPVGIGSPPCWSGGGATGASNGATRTREYRADALRWLIDPATGKRLTGVTFKLPGSAKGNRTPMTEGAMLVVVFRTAFAFSLSDASLRSIVDSGSSAVVTTAGDHGLLPGSLLTVSGATASALNGNYAVQAVLSPKSFTISTQGVADGTYNNQALAVAPPLTSVVIDDGTFTLAQGTELMTRTVSGFYQASAARPLAKLTIGGADGQANFGERISVNGALCPSGRCPLLSSSAPPSISSDNPFVGHEGPGWDNPTFDISGLIVPGSVSLNLRAERVPGSFDCITFGVAVTRTTVEDADNDGIPDIVETGLAPDGTYTFLDGSTLNLKAMGAVVGQKDLFVEVDAETGQFPPLEVFNKVGDAFKNAPVDPLPGGKFKGISVHFDAGDRYVSPYIIKGAKRGGEEFSLGGSTLGWKKGFRLLRDGKPIVVAGKVQKDLYELAWPRRFERNRRQFFHYGIFARALTTKTKVSGVADLLGPNFAVTVGNWQNASTFTKTATLFHEIGHNLGLWHGGGANALNCKPNYISTMNYMFQTAGVINAAGLADIAFSGQVLRTLNEGALTESAMNAIDGAVRAHQTRFYAPLVPGTLAFTLGSTAATRHCDGTLISGGEPAMARIDTHGPVTAGTSIDWNGDGLLTVGPSFVQDIGFNGRTDAGLDGFNDWSIVAAYGLKQVSSGRNVVGLSLDVTYSDLPNKGDAGLGDAGLGDAGLGDAGLGDAGLGDAGLGDAGLGDQAGDAGLGGPGYGGQQGDAGLGDAGLGADADFETMTSYGSPPVNLTVRRTGDGVVLAWMPPTVVAGSITAYKIYAVSGSTVTLKATVAGTKLTYIAGSAENATITYFVTATDTDGSRVTVSGPSNMVVVSNR